MDDPEDESISKQILNLMFENQIFSIFAGGWVVFNMVVLVLLIYISIRISLK